jgi:hypothetical protein
MKNEEKKTNDVVCVCFFFRSSHTQQQLQPNRIESFRRMNNLNNQNKQQDDTTVCEIEEIRAISYTNKNKTTPFYYLIKWLNQPEENETTWEPHENIIRAKDAIEEYQNRPKKWTWMFYVSKPQDSFPKGWFPMDHPTQIVLSNLFESWLLNCGQMDAQVIAQAQSNYPINLIGVDQSDSTNYKPIVQSGNYKYIIDFSKMEQQNQDPSLRTIKRISCLQHKSS